jgi:hypothetical protein
MHVKPCSFFCKFESPITPRRYTARSRQDDDRPPRSVAPRVVQPTLLYCTTLESVVFHSHVAASLTTLVWCPVMFGWRNHLKRVGGGLCKFLGHLVKKIGATKGNRREKGGHLNVK